jgi:hypothetical protein
MTIRGWGKTRWLGSWRACEGGKEEGRGRAIGAILLAEELAHARLPPPALVEGDASVLGAAPGEPRALPPEHVDELLLAQVAHLLHVVVVILQAEIDVGLHAAELDRRPIVRPKVDGQTEQRLEFYGEPASDWRRTGHGSQ